MLIDNLVFVDGSAQQLALLDFLRSDSRAEGVVILLEVLLFVVVRDVACACLRRGDAAPSAESLNLARGKRQRTQDRPLQPDVALVQSVFASHIREAARETGL